MSVSIDKDKKRLSKAEANYLFQRPWLTDSKTRQQLRKMLYPETAPEPVSEPDENPNESEE